MERLDAIAPCWRTQTLTRLIAGLFACLMLAPIVSLTHLAAWLFAYLVFQIGSVFVLTGASRRRFSTGALQRQTLILYSVHSSFFCTVAVLAAASGHALGLTFAVGILGGSLTNSVATSGGSKRLFVFSTAPTLVGACVLLPATAFWRSHVIVDTIMLGLSGALSIVMTAGIWRRYADTLAAEHRAKLQADAANDAKSRFIAILSHEIRTPLNGVLGMAQAIAGGPLELDQRQRLDVVQSSGQALLAILNDVLDLAKLESGKLELEAIPFELGELLLETAHMYEGTASAKRIDLRLLIDSAAGTFVGDPLRLRQIVTNLLSNALKFTHEGSVELRAEWREGHLELCVSDTGIGMTADVLARLFSAYAQAESATARRYGGTGLGLSICRDLARAMGGDIGAESDAGRGSKFTLKMPLARAEESGPCSPGCETGLASGNEFHGEVRLLAVDDNETNRLVLRTLLSQVGVEITTVESGQAALAAWLDAQWDLILMDVEMPDMDGPTVTRAIRKHERSQGRNPTPILAVSANAMPSQVQAYLDAGMDGHVAKPIVVPQLLAAISAALASGEEDRDSEIAA